MPCRLNMYSFRFSTPVSIEQFHVSPHFCFTYLNSFLDFYSEKNVFSSLKTMKSLCCVIGALIKEIHGSMGIHKEDLI